MKKVMERKKELTLLRRQELKRYRNLANQYLSENIHKKDSHKHKWENLVYENNIKQLRKLISEIKQESTDSVIETFVSNELFMDQSGRSVKNSLFREPGIRDAFNNIRSEIQEYKIVRYSPTFSVIHDLYWIEDGTIEDKKDIALGRKLPEIYGRYLNNKIIEIEDNIYPLLESRLELIQSLKILKSAIYNLKNNNYATGNILIITIIEGIVRLACKNIYLKQNP